MIRSFVPLALIGSSLAAVPVPAMAGSITVTRFFAPEAPARLAPQPATSITVVAADARDPASLELAPWLAAVAAGFAKAGFAVGPSVSAAVDTATLRAEVRVDTRTLAAPPDHHEHGAVSLGFGDGGVGFGFGFAIGGKPKPHIETRLLVVLRDRVSGQALWQGEAEVSERQGSKAASVDVLALRLVTAVLGQFPGTSGATETVK